MYFVAQQRIISSAFSEINLNDDYTDIIVEIVHNRGDIKR